MVLWLNVVLHPKCGCFMYEIENKWLENQMNYLVMVNQRAANKTNIRLHQTTTVIPWKKGILRMILIPIQNNWNRRFSMLVRNVKAFPRKFQSIQKWKGNKLQLSIVETKQKKKDSVSAHSNRFIKETSKAFLTNRAMILWYQMSVCDNFRLVLLTRASASIQKKETVIQQLWKQEPKNRFSSFFQEWNFSMYRRNQLKRETKM